MNFMTIVVALCGEMASDLEEEPELEKTIKAFNESNTFTSIF